MKGSVLQSGEEAGWRDARCAPVEENTDFSMCYLVSEGLDRFLSGSVMWVSLLPSCLLV